MRLGYLVFAPNSAYVQVVEKMPKGVAVDLGKKTWTYEHSHHRQPEPIGQSCYLGHRRGGVIGVYDLDDIKQISSMVHDAIESQRDYSNAD